MRKHAELIIAWANGADIQFKNGANWMDIPMPAWSEIEVYRVKPAAPVIETNMTDSEIEAIIRRIPPETNYTVARRAIANAAIARAIADGQVVPADNRTQFQKALANGKEEAMAKIDSGLGIFG